ncbi:MAG TPA: flagellar hook-basal body complex protein FliE [Firmicutes bacterium]|nr:flagellar hook-basal body complex protein FliE [Bacillota bacterium]
MLNKIGALSSLPSNTAFKRTGEPNERPGSFRSVLAKALEEVNGLQLDAQDKTRLLLAGEDVELHQVMLAAQKAELALELTQTVRNKVVEAYQEIMRMQV